MKVRLDKLLVDRGLAASRERAQALILAGRVLVNQQKIEKSGVQIEDSADIRLLGHDLQFVSRGGLKLQAALQHWGMQVEGRTCLDIGASTGGFTDCLLQAGAARVIAVDTGYGQLESRLRADPRVRLLERTNARYITAEQVGERVDCIVMDVSFISATLVLPAVLQAVRAHSTAFELVVLIKPQFEAGREQVGKGGIVRDPQAQQQAVERVRAAVSALGGHDVAVIESPITGAEGNREFLLRARF